MQRFLYTHPPHKILFVGYNYGKYLMPDLHICVCLHYYKCVCLFSTVDT